MSTTTTMRSGRRIKRAPALQGSEAAREVDAFTPGCALAAPSLSADDLLRLIGDRPASDRAGAEGEDPSLTRARSLAAIAPADEALHVRPRPPRRGRS